MTNFQKNRLFLHLVTNIFSHMFTIIFWIIVALIAYAFREELMAAAFVGIFMGEVRSFIPPFYPSLPVSGFWRGRACAF